ncbi:hypothetical protein [Hyalangium gracile]|uniref:hypothetical protein n=1 Tax=Hyalangium gracile TaxID=394092 RepID=UPI001CCEBDD6|nr:hypothetical protein [Hyalangium gracile]
MLLDGYEKQPRWRWGEGGRGQPVSLRSRWIIGSCLVALPLLLIPEVRELIPVRLRLAPVQGLVVVFLMLLLAVWLVQRLPLIPRRRRPSSLSRGEQRQLRRERKEQRLRRAQARRNG